MRSGPMRHRVTIQQATVSQDAYGEPIESWAVLATVWASIRSKAAGERFISGGEQVQANVSHTVSIRYRSDVTVKMRLLWGSRYLYIENVIDPTGYSRELVLMCREEQT